MNKSSTRVYYRTTTNTTKYTTFENMDFKRFSKSHDFNSLNSRIGFSSHLKNYFNKFVVILKITLKCLYKIVRVTSKTDFNILYVLRR